MQCIEGTSRYQSDDLFGERASLPALIWNHSLQIRFVATVFRHLDGGNFIAQGGLASG